MTDRMSAAQFQAQTTKAKRSKYGAVRVTIDGLNFDSKREGEVYCELKLRERAGEICNVELQKPFPILIGGFLVGTYKSDFAYHEIKSRKDVVIDVKGFDTPLSKFKRKCVKAQYGVEVVIVK